ncbi:MAG: ATP-binding protein, partial [Fuerstiella sp.]
LAVQREVAFFEIEMSARHEQLVVAIRPDLRELWRRAGAGGSLEYLRYDGNERQVRSRWVWLDNTADVATLPVVDREQLLDIPKGKLTAMRYLSADGIGLYCSYFPFALPDGRLGALEIAESLVPRDQYTRDTIVRTVTLMAAMVGATGLVVALFGVKIIGQPLQALIEKTQRVAEGDLTTPVYVGGNDELSMLAKALNQMGEKLHESQQQVLKEAAQRIEAMEQLRHGDRLKTLGRLASGVAHELGTPLNVITGRAGLIAGGRLQQSDVVTSAATIQSEANRMTGLIQQLLNFARRSTPNRTSLDVNTIVERTVSLVEPIATKNTAAIQIVERSLADVRVNVDAAQMQQVLSNLLINAVMSRESGVKVEVSTSLCDACRPEDSSGIGIDCVKICVADDGCGISAEDLPHVFEPFFTTRDVGKGTGLGLSIAHEIVAEHGGWMNVASVPQQGATFCVFLPVEKKS